MVSNTNEFECKINTKLTFLYLNDVPNNIIYH